MVQLDDELLQRIKNNDPSLKELRFDNDSVDGSSVRRLSEFLATGNTVIRELILSKNNIGPGVKSLANTLATGKTAITVLDICENDISTRGARSLAKALATGKTAITELNLSYNSIQSTGGKVLANALATGMTSITKLNLDRNSIRNLGAQHLADALATGNTAITELNLGDNSIDSSGVQHLANALATGKTSITKLNLRTNWIRDTGAQHLANALATGNTSITNLNLPHNRIESSGVKHIANALATGKTAITELNLGDNSIDSSSVKHIANALATGKTAITELNFENNGIGSSGAQHIANALTTGNTAITELNLGDNGIESSGVQHIANALATGKTTITKLDFQYNTIDSAGMQHLADALATGKTAITELNLDQNSIESCGVKHIAEALATGKTAITKMNLKHNKIDSSGAQHIANALTTGNTAITELNLEYNPIEHQAMNVIDALIVGIRNEQELRAQQEEHDKLKDTADRYREQCQNYEQQISSLEQELSHKKSEVEELQFELQKQAAEEGSLGHVENTIKLCLSHVGLLQNIQHDGKEKESDSDEQDQHQPPLGMVQSQKHVTSASLSFPLYPAKDDTNEKQRLESLERNIMNLMHSLLRDDQNSVEAMHQLVSQLQEVQQQQKEHLEMMSSRIQRQQSFLKSTSLRSLSQLLQSLTDSGTDAQIQNMEGQLHLVRNRQDQLSQYSSLHGNLVRETDRLRALYDELRQRDIEIMKLHVQIAVAEDQDSMSKEQLKQNYDRLDRMRDEAMSLRRSLEQLDQHIFEQCRKYSMPDVTLQVIRERCRRAQPARMKKRLHTGKPVHKIQDGASPDGLQRWLRDQVHLLVDRRFERDYYQLKVLSYTNMGHVVLARLKGVNSVRDGRDNADIVVLKRLPWAPHAEKHIRNEIRLMSQMRHPHIAELRAVFIDGNDIYLEMNYYEQGDLKGWMKTKRPFHEIRNILRQMLQGIGFLHARGVVHRDLKPDNILVDSDDVVRVSDFGISQDTTAPFQLTKSTLFSAGTEAYMAPERIHHQAPASESTDMWSVGIIFGELLFSGWQLHFNDRGGVVLPNGEPAYGMTARQHQVAIDLIRNLLVVSPENEQSITEGRSPRRLSAVEVLNHELFTMDTLEMHRHEKSILESEDKLKWFQLYMRQYREKQQQLDPRREIVIRNVHRIDVVSTVLQSLSNNLTAPGHLFHRMWVSYSGESGIDEGGLTNDLLTQFFSQLLDGKHGLFVAIDNDECPHLLVPSDDLEIDELYPLRTEHNFELIGRLLMKCLLDEKALILPLHPMVFSVLLDREDPSPYSTAAPNTITTIPLSGFQEGNSKWWLMEAERTCCPELVSRMRMTKSMVQSGQHQLKDLLGDDSVRNCGINEYIVSLLRKKLVTGEHGNRLRYLRAMRRGFLKLAPQRQEFIDSYVKKLSGGELQLLLCGPSYLDADMIFTQMDCPSGMVTFIRRLLKSLSERKLRHFLLWVTALGALPHSGKLSRRITVKESNRFMSHTCFNELEIDGSYLPPRGASDEEVENAFHRFRTHMLNMINLALSSGMEEMG